MNAYDVLIIGGGAAGMSCALVLGSAHKTACAKDKKIGIVMHQKASHLQDALFNNVLGMPSGTLGVDVLRSGKEQLTDLYPHVEQIEKEKVQDVISQDGFYEVVTNKATYRTSIVVVAVGYTNLFHIKGLQQYVAPHPRAKAEKNRVYLQNEDHKITEGLYVAGTLAGWRSQFAMAAGSGAHVATDVLTLWNKGVHIKVHDKWEI